jgi:hypothetical protein
MASSTVTGLTQQSTTDSTSIFYAAGSSGSTDTGLPLSVLFTSPTFTGTTHVAALTATGAITPDPTVGLIGSTNNLVASAGSVGEYVTQAFTGFATANGVLTNIASISLGAGDWEVEGFARALGAGSTTWTNISLGLNNVSATLPAVGFYANTTLQFTAVTNPAFSMQAPIRHVLQGSTTTWYLVCLNNFSAGSVACDGFIRARRER